MKNFILLSIAIFLGIFTYFYHEKGDQKRIEEFEKRGLLLDPSKLGKILGIKTMKTELVLKDGHFIDLSTKRKVSIERLNKFYEILSGIKMRRTLEKDHINQNNRKQYFPEEESKMEFLFENGQASFVLGKKLDFDQGFYVEVQTTDRTFHVTAFDSRSVKGNYLEKEAHRHDLKYKRFRSLFFLGTNYFEDLRIFRSWLNEKITLERFSIDGRRNRKFSVLLTEAQTIPRAPKGVGIYTENLQKFGQKMGRMIGKSVYTKFSKNELKKKESILEITTHLGEAKLELYKEFRNKKGYFVQSSLDGFIYELKRSDGPFFFYNIQDFWDLTPLGKKKQINKIEIQFSGQKNIFRGQFLRGQNFQALFAGYTSSHKKFYDLENFLLKRANLFYEGNALKEGFKLRMRLSLDGADFHIMTRGQEILVAYPDQKEGFLYYIENSAIIGFKQSDYLR